MNNGGYIDVNELSQEDVKQHGICFDCHKSIKTIIKLEKPITFGERMTLSLPVTGEVLICDECNKLWNKTLKLVINNLDLISNK